MEQQPKPITVIRSKTEWINACNEGVISLAEIRQKVEAFDKNPNLPITARELKEKNAPSISAQPAKDSSRELPDWLKRFIYPSSTGLQEFRFDRGRGSMVS